jgi:hypothetical protein
MSRRLLACLAVASILALTGLIHFQYVDCSVIHKGWPADRSDYVQVRGFPFGWLLTDDVLCAAALHWWQRFLAARFLVSFTTDLAAVLLVAALIDRIRLRLSRQIRLG